MPRTHVLCAAVTSLVLACVVPTALAHDAPVGLPELTVRAEPDQTATLILDLPLGTGHSRRVKADVSIRLSSGSVRVEFIDSKTETVFARTAFMSAEELELFTEYQISGEGTLSPTTDRVRCRITARSGEVKVTTPQVARVEASIDEEDFSDLEALRAAAAALESGLSDLPKVSAEDHAAACDDPTHNHGPGGHTHGTDAGHTHGADAGHTHGADAGHTHGADAGHTHGADAGHTHPPGAGSGDSKDKTPLTSSERAELRALRAEVEKLRRELDQLRPTKKPERKSKTRPGNGSDPAPTLAFYSLAGPTPNSFVQAEPLQVVATLPILASLAQTIGGDAVETNSLTPPGVDPHDVHMTPALTANLKNANLFIESGMGLEGWTSRAVAASGNTAIVPGGAGHVYATTSVTPIEKPTAEEIAAGGHVHAAGNPHVWLSPLNVKVMAANIEAALSKLQPASAAEFARRSATLQREIDERLFGPRLVEIIGSRTIDRLHRAGRLIPFLEKKKLKGEPLITSLDGWLGRTRKLAKRKLITYHRTWSYMTDCFALEVVGTIEEKPGIPPSPTHLARLTELAKQTGVEVVAAPPYYPRNRIDALAARIGGKSVVLPTQPGESADAKDTLSLFEDIVKRIESVQ